MLRSSLALLLAAFGGAAPASAVMGAFIIDSTQSSIALVPGQLSPLGGSVLTLFVGTFDLSNIPLRASSFGTGGMLPDGSTSDGLRTSLEGRLFAEVGDALDTVRLIGRRSVVELGTSGSWLPGVPSAFATASSGDAAVEFSDPITTAAAQLVLRDAVLSVDSGGQLPLSANGSGGFSFAAGCNPGGTCAAFRVEDAVIDGDSSQGPIGRVGVGRSDPVLNPPGTQGLVEPLGGGRFRITIPINASATLTTAEIGGGFPLSLDLALTGQIVAVPEPSGAMLGEVALACVAALAAVRRRIAR